MDSRPGVSYDGSWVGLVNTGSGLESVQVRLETRDGSTRALVDRPHRLDFGAEARQATWIAAVGRPMLELSLGGGLAGRVRLAVAAGDLPGGEFAPGPGEGHLWREVELSQTKAGSLLGPYALASGESLTIGQRADGMRVVFLMRGDRITRIHPVSDSLFVSESAEWTEIDGSSISVRLPSGERRVGTRLHAFDAQDVRFPSGDHEISGTLLLPPGKGPHAAVVLCHGAGPSQRDFYRIFAERYARKGIAALVYDKRGCGESTGRPLSSEVELLAEDAVEAVRFLRGHPAIDAARVGLWGFSNGGWVAPLAASTLGDAAFVVPVSAAGVTPARQEVFRRTRLARSLGASETAVATLTDFWTRAYDFMVRGEWTGELARAFESVYADRELMSLPSVAGLNPWLQAIPPVAPLDGVRAQMGGSYPSGAFDPAPIYSGLKCPLLFLWGADDESVPVDESRRCVESALRASGHRDHEFRVFPAATHMLTKVIAATPEAIAKAQFGLHNVEFAPGALDAMVDWVVEHT